MHDQTHLPPARSARPMEPTAKRRRPVRRPVAPGGESPEGAAQPKKDGGLAVEPPAGPPPIVARILRACAACHGQQEEKRSGALALSQPGDPLEKEADQIADRVMRTADPAAVRASPAIRVSRSADDEETPLARAEAPGATSGGAAPMVRDTLRSSGQPLSGATRAFMEPRFGRDFGDVRVHTDARASKSAEAVSALAYTVGSNIVFRSGQYAPEAPAGARLLAHELAHVAQQAPGAPIQRAADKGATDKHAADGGTAMTGAKPTSAATGVIVEDDETTALDPKQMRKSAFLAALRPKVEEAVDDGYSSVVDRITGRAAVAVRFAMYSAQNAKSLEQTLHREVGGAGSAAGYMGAITARVRAEVAADEAGKNKKEAAEDKDHGIFFKAREGGPRAPDDPRTVKAALGQGGQPLPSRVRTGMESAMGQDFSGVRVHTGATAVKVSSGLNARALTVGQDIAFAAGEYQPGTPIGDALIAHELAHVVQQGNSRDAAVAAKSESAHDGPLETAADEAAMGAVLSMWGGIKTGALGLARKVGAGLKTGLKLQRCSSKSKWEEYQAAMEELKKFKAGTYEARNFEPSTGKGKFDVAYMPSSTLAITLKVWFRFVNGSPHKFKGFSPASYTWTKEEENIWATNYIQVVSRKWSSAHTFYCTKDWWDELSATTHVHVMEMGRDEVEDRWAPNTGEQYMVKVTKVPSGLSEEQRKKLVEEPRTDDPGLKMPWDPGIVHLDSESLKPNEKGQTTAEHEAGHMLGLGDEYPDPMGRKGLQHKDAVKKELGKDISAGKDGRIMSEGSEIGQEHGVTFLEALRKATGMKEWSFNKPVPKPVPTPGDAGGSGDAGAP